MAEITGLGLASPAPDRECHCPGAFGRKLQATRADHRQAHEFADDGSKTTEGKPLLHIRQHLLVLVGLDKDHPVGMKADLRQSWKEKVRARQTPDDLPFGPRCDAGGKQCSRGPIDSTRATAGKLMKGAMAETATGQNSIDLWDAEC